MKSYAERLKNIDGDLLHFRANKLCVTPLILSCCFFPAEPDDYPPNSPNFTCAYIEAEMQYYGCLSCCTFPLHCCVNPVIALFLGCLWIGECPKCLFCIEMSNVCKWDSPSNLCHRHFDTIIKPCIRFPCTVFKHCTSCGVSKNAENRQRKLRLLRTMQSNDIFTGEESQISSLRANFSALKGKLRFFEKCVDNSLPTEPIPNILFQLKSFIRELQSVKEIQTQEISDLENVCIYLSGVIERGGSDATQVASVVSPYLRIMRVPEVRARNRAVSSMMGLEPEEVPTMLESIVSSIGSENYKKFLVILARLALYKVSRRERESLNPLESRLVVPVEQTEKLESIITDIEFLAGIVVDASIQGLLKDVLTNLKYDHLQDSIVISDINEFLNALDPILKIERVERKKRLRQEWETILSHDLFSQFNILLKKLDVLRRIKHFLFLKGQIAGTTNRRDIFAWTEQQKDLNLEADQINSETRETLLHSLSSFSRALEAHRIAPGFFSNADDVDRNQKYTDLQIHFYNISILLQRKVGFFSMETEEELDVQAIEFALDFVGFSYTRVRSRDQFASDNGSDTFGFFVVNVLL